jgi:hypothetical protein
MCGSMLEYIRRESCLEVTSWLSSAEQQRAIAGLAEYRVANAVL